jgi:hypothetical protein
VEVFATRLRDQVDLGALPTELLGVVDQTMQPTHAWLWLTTPGPSGHGRRGRDRRSPAMETTEVHGLRIAYERAGDGPPLVPLHGYVGDGPTTRRPQLEGLGDEFIVIAWDAPGAGRSSDPPESFGMTGYADCLAGSSSASAWSARTWPGCPSVARSPWPSSAATPPCRRP